MPAIISPYRGFGRGHEMLVRGRLMMDKRVTRATEAEPLWLNLINTWRRFESDEIAGARARVSYRDAVVESVTNHEGHFQVRLEPRELAGHLLWHEVACEAPDHNTSAIARVLIPAAAEFGIISDIDDTIVHTGATSLVTMIRSVINNAAARLPFEGVAELYRALHRDRNPIFYVSSSPWNLYELLDDFMNLNGIPAGPMLLQDWGIDRDTLIIDPHERHKLAQIQTLLDYYHDLRFVLIGDSGQKDPEIYLRAMQVHPNRVIAAFIRDVTGDTRDQAVARIAEGAKAAGSEMIYVRDSAHAFEEARRLGLVP